MGIDLSTVCPPVLDLSAPAGGMEFAQLLLAQWKFVLDHRLCYLLERHRVSQSARASTLADKNGCHSAHRNGRCFLGEVSSFTDQSAAAPGRSIVCFSV